MKMTSYCGSLLMPTVPSLPQNASSGKSSRRIIFIVCGGNQGAFCGTHAAISSRLQPEVLLARTHSARADASTSESCMVNGSLEVRSAATSVSTVR